MFADWLMNSGTLWSEPRESVGTQRQHSRGGASEERVDVLIGFYKFFT